MVGYLSTVQTDGSAMFAGDIGAQKILLVQSEVEAEIHRFQKYPIFPESLVSPASEPYALS
jgi:hypothetical protein